MVREKLMNLRCTGASCCFKEASQIVVVVAVAAVVVVIGWWEGLIAKVRLPNLIKILDVELGSAATACGSGRARPRASHADRIGGQDE